MDNSLTENNSTEPVPVMFFCKGWKNLEDLEHSFFQFY